MLTRRRLLQLALVPLPVSLALGSPATVRAWSPAPAGPLPVPADALAGCVNSWRLDLAPLMWSGELVAGCEGWARHLASEGMKRPDGSWRHSLPWLGRECIAAHQADWSEAFTAWTKSDSHLDTLRHDQAWRVAMAGYSDGTGHYWVLRVD